jgi:hypothetical protein
MSKKLDPVIEKAAKKAEKKTKKIIKYNRRANIYSEGELTLRRAGARQLNELSDAEIAEIDWAAGLLDLLPGLLVDRCRDLLWVLTPAAVGMLLAECAAPNRVKRRNFMSDIVDMILSGLLRVKIGEPIMFDPKGRFCNGQHRLGAFAASQKTVVVLVLFDVTPEDIIHGASLAKQSTAERVSMTIANVSAAKHEACGEASGIAAACSVINVAFTPWSPRRGKTRRRTDRVMEIVQVLGPRIHDVLRQFEGAPQKDVNMASIHYAAVRASYGMPAQLHERATAVLLGRVSGQPECVIMERVRADILARQGGVGLSEPVASLTSIIQVLHAYKQIALGKGGVGHAMMTTDCRPEDARRIGFFFDWPPEVMAVAKEFHQ